MKDKFSLDEWLESVEGEQINIDKSQALGSNPPVLTVKYSDMVYCKECDDFRLLIKEECPVCGRKPGALERGTDFKKAEDYRIVNDNGEIIYKKRDKKCLFFFVRQR